MIILQTIFIGNSEKIIINNKFLKKLENYWIFLIKRLEPKGHKIYLLNNIVEKWMLVFHYDFTISHTEWKKINVI